MTRQLYCFIFFHRPRMLSRSAKANTSRTPCPVFAEHSMYFAPISFATAAPCSGVTGVVPCAPSIRLVCSSFRRSVFVPTRIKGVPSQKCDTSGNHCVAIIKKARKGGGAHTYFILYVGKTGRKVYGENNEDHVAF